MVTPYDPSRGIDLYIDSSGEDDWDLETEVYYLHGLMLCGPSKEWIEWMRIHKTKYEGMVHWSHHRFGKRKKLEGVKAKCRELLASHPWFRTAVFIIDKKEFQEYWLAKRGRLVRKYEVSSALWKNMGAAFLSTAIPSLKRIAPDDAFGCLNVHDVLVNIPKGGKRQEIQRAFQQLVNRTPMFAPAGHPGIDALDAVLWAFHRCVNLGKPDCIPNLARSFSKDLSVSVVGLASGALVRLDDVDAIESFRKAA